MTESGEMLDDAVEAARLVGNVQGLAWNLLNRSLAATAMGDVELAVATAEESADLAMDLDGGPVVGRRRRSDVPGSFKVKWLELLRAAGSKTAARRGPRSAARAGHSTPATRSRRAAELRPPSKK